jgi:hypothetical protein
MTRHKASPPRRATLALAGIATAATMTGCGIPGMASTTPPASSSTALAGNAAHQLANLTIAPDGTMAGYERNKFGDGWASMPDGCSARDHALARQGHDLHHDGQCEITSGTWTSPYDGKVIHNPSELDADHLVPLADAWRTGAAQWTDQKRETFANDPAEIIMVTAHANRSKQDDTPPAYEPSNHADLCRYAQRWTSLKAKYQLTVTRTEHNALNHMLGTCPSS